MVCIQAIREWMQKNVRKLNDVKTAFLVIVSNKHFQQVTNYTIQIGDEITSSASAHNIGAIFDSKMSMKEHVHTLCNSCYCHVRNLGNVRQKATFTLIHAFISSKIDHMNAHLYDISKYLMNKLQLIQNNVA